MRALLISTALFLSLVCARIPPACAAPVQVNWITQYCNESTQVANLANQPRMITNLQNSLMSVAPAYLDGATYLQRRSDTNLCPDLAGIAELSMEWLRPDRVDLATPAVVVVAVNELAYPEAGALLLSEHWTALGSKIRVEYNEAPRELTLYAGLVPAGPVELTGSGVNAFEPQNNDTGARGSYYFFFQQATAFSPETLAQLQAVTVPEPSALALAGVGSLAILTCALRRRSESH